jgi:hypothetical protein
MAGTQARDSAPPRLGQTASMMRLAHEVSRVAHHEPLVVIRQTRDDVEPSSVCRSAFRNAAVPYPAQCLDQEVRQDLQCPAFRRRINGDMSS